jgi:hypothetical protein
MGLVGGRDDDLAGLDHTGVASVGERRLPRDDEEELGIWVFCGASGP